MCDADHRRARRGLLYRWQQDAHVGRRGTRHDLDIGPRGRRALHRPRHAHCAVVDLHSGLRRAPRAAPGGHHFWSRRAYELAYASQRETKFDRAFRRARKLRLRLGAAPADDECPDKPLRMRWATYNRLMDRLVAADAVTDERLKAARAIVDQVRPWMTPTTPPSRTPWWEGWWPRPLDRSPFFRWWRVSAAFGRSAHRHRSFILLGFPRQPNCRAAGGRLRQYLQGARRERLISASALALF